MILNGIDEFVRGMIWLTGACFFAFRRSRPQTASRGRVLGVIPRRLSGDPGWAVGRGGRGSARGRTLELTELPRMADFARFGEAVGRGLGWPADTFLSAYSDNRYERTETAARRKRLGDFAAQVRRLRWAGELDFAPDRDAQATCRGCKPKSKGIGAG